MGWGSGSPRQMNKFCKRIALLALLWGNAVYALDVPAVIEAKYIATISAEQNGVLKKLPVSLGDRVEQGNAIAVLDHAAIDSELARKRLRREYLQSQLTNLKRLVSQGLASDDELRKATTEERLVLADILELKRKVARSTIKAPFAGAVVELMVNKHEWVQIGQPLMRLLSPAELRLRASVPTELLVGLNDAKQYEVHFPELNQTAKITIETIAPEVEVQSNTVAVLWSLQGNKNKFLAGMKGIIRLAKPKLTNE